MSKENYQGFRPLRMKYLKRKFAHFYTTLFFLFAAAYVFVMFFWRWQL